MSEREKNILECTYIGFSNGFARASEHEHRGISISCTFPTFIWHVIAIWLFGKEKKKNIGNNIYLDLIEKKKNKKKTFVTKMLFI